MERIVIAVFAALFILAAIIESRRAEKKRQAARAAKCRDRWGQRPEREYSYEEFARIPHYYRKKNVSSGVDDTTWNDLDMDNVFLDLNHTFSSVGEEYLYYSLRTPISDEEELHRRREKTRYFRENREDALQLQQIYSRMGYARRIALSDYLFSLPDAPEIPIKKEAAVISLLVLSLVLAAAGVPYAAFVSIICLVYNIIRYYQLKGTVENRFSGIAYLVGMTGFAEEIARLPFPVLDDVRPALLSAAEPFRPVRRWAGLISLGGSVGGSFADILMDYIRMIFHVDLLAYAKIIHTVKTHRKELEELMAQLGYVESCLAIASWRDSLPYTCDPQLSFGKPFIRAKKIFHPLLDDPVANDFETVRPVIVTGSNASGKSTFLKTIAISAILAQTVSAVPAESYEGTYVQVLSSMDIKDHLQEGESYFVAEIRSIRRMFQARGGLPCLFFIDEVLKGTNTVERIAASTQILKSLTGDDCLTFTATHDIELTSLLAKDYDNYHFTEEILDDDVRFSFRILPGPADTRNAIRLLRLMGYSEDIVEKAENLAQDFLKTGVWKADNN